MQATKTPGPDPAPPGASTEEALRREVDELRARNAELLETINAIRRGEVDAIVVAEDEQPRVYSLEGTDHLYRVLVEKIQEGALTLSPEGLVLFANAAFAEMLALPLSAVLGTLLPDHLRTPDRERFLALLEQAGTTACRGDLSLRSGTGALPVAFSLTPIATGGGMTISAVVTDRRRDYGRLLLQSRMLDSVLDAVSAVAPDGTIIYWNLAAERLYGWSADEVIGRSLHDAALSSGEPDEEEARAVFEMLIAGGTWSGEHMARHRDGRIFPVQGAKAPVFDEDGAIVAMIGTSQDISERKRAEEALRKSEAGMARAQATAHVGSWEWDLDRDLLSSSDEHTRIYGLPPGEHPVETFIDLVHEDDRQYVRDALAATLRVGVPYGAECRIVRPDGAMRTVIGQGEAVRDATGRITGMFGIAQDITERKRTEAALQESEAKFRALIETNADFVWEMDAEGRYTYCSPQMETLWGLKPEEMIGRTPFDQMPPAERARALAAFMDPSMPAVLRSLESVGYDARGNLVHLEISRIPFYAGDGTLLGYRGTTRDVTERRRLDEELSASARAAELRAGELDAALISMASGVNIYDVSGAIVRMNEAAKRMLGISGGTLECEDYDRRREKLGIARPDGTPLAKEDAPYHRALHGEIVRGEEVVFTGVGEEPLHVVTSASPIRDREGRIAGAIAVFTDISGQRRAAERLRESEALFRRTFDQAPFGAALVRPDYTFVRANAALCRMLGYSEDELLEKTFSEFTHPDDVESDLRLAAELEAGTIDQYTVDTRYIRKDGTVIWGSRSVRYVRDDDGRILYILPMVEDITERKHAEAALERERARLQAILDALPVGVWIADADGKMLEVNEVAGEIWGGTAPAVEQVDGYDVYRAWRTGTDERVASDEMPLARALQGETVMDEVFDFERFDGSKGTQIVTAAPVLSSTGVIAGGIAVASDITRLVETQTALREAEEHYRFALDAARFGTFEFRIETGEVVWDERLKAIWGLAPEENLDFAGVMDRVHPDDRERVRRIFAAGLAPDGDGTYQADFRIVRPDGSVRWTSARGHVHFRTVDGSRRAVRVVGIEHDITELKRAEAELIKYAARLQASERDARMRAEEIAVIYDTAPVGLCVLDRDLRFVRLNQRFAEINGVPVPAHLDRTPGEVVPDLGEQAEEALRRVLETGERVDLEVSGETPADPGVVRYWDERWIPIHDDAGAIVGISVSAMEVTERKRAEAALLESSEKYRDLFLHDITGNFIAAADGRILDCNPAFARIFGFSSVEEALGSSIVDTYASPGERDALLEQIRAGVPVEFDKRFRRRRDGTPIHVVENIMGIFDRDGNLVRTQGYIIDDTERHFAEQALREFAEELRRSNEDLERFAYVSSHDLQEPLRSIVSFSQLLERRYRGKLDAAADEYIDFIVEGGTRMQTLIQDLLAYSRVNTTKQALMPTATGEVLAAVERNLAPQLAGPGATLTSGVLPTVMADPVQLEQIFANLVSNAIKFRRDDVPLAIRVSADRVDDMVEFSVQDNGIGIEPQYFDRIFTIFQRLHTKDAYPGTGIGLAIVKRIVDRHGGRIWLESTPGEGSTFFFTLPAA